MHPFIYILLIFFWRIHAIDVPSLPSADLTGPWSDLLKLVDMRKGNTNPAVAKLKSYLFQFGYCAELCGSLDSQYDDAVETAVKLYQKNFKLQVTGDLNRETIAQMVKPRCGGKDVDNGTSQMQKIQERQGVKHYAFFPGSPRWISKSDLTYAFSGDSGSLPKGIPTKTLRDVLQRAFARWAAVVPITFREIFDVGKADIVVSFASFEHGDGNPFDGALGVLAHAFSPEDGRFHLDLSEKWSVDLKSDISITAMHLESVAVHEIGHLIGLGHSGDLQAVMFPSIAPREIKTELARDDIDGAQALYGVNPNFKPGTPVSVGTENSGLMLENIAKRVAPSAGAAIGFNVTLLAWQGAGKILRISCATPVAAPLVGCIAVGSASIVAAQVNCVLESIINKKKLAFISSNRLVIHAALGMVLFKVLGGRYSNVLPSDLSFPGALSRASVPARGSRYATDSEAQLIRELYIKHGCHHCGSYKGISIADHMPPNIVVKNRMIENIVHKKKSGSIFFSIGRFGRNLLNRFWKVELQRFYPQCEACMKKQSAALRHGKRKLVYHFKVGFPEPPYLTGFFVSFLMTDEVQY